MTTRTTTNTGKPRLVSSSSSTAVKHKELVFRLAEKGPPIIRNVLMEKGWVEYDEENLSPDQHWNLWWKSSRFTPSQLAACHYPYQHVNHFPKSSEITKKDSLLRNLRRMKGIYGAVCDFIPDSYVLPNEYVKFCQLYADLREKEQQAIWICKPSDMSRGRKIFVFRDLGDLTYDCTAIVQRYVDNPLLIADYKFDLRVYVLVTSFQPLRVYMYRDMLVRFGTEKYCKSDLSNIYSHLTNYSLNKFAPNYDNEKDGIGEGCKWNLPRLKEFFDSLGVDFTLIQNRIETIVLITLLSIAPSIPHAAPCFELYGFDVLLDQSLKPWLLEVNFSPALAVEGEVDGRVKLPLITDMIDTLNIKPFDERFVCLEPEGFDRSARSHVRNPTELTAASAAKAGNPLPYPLPRGFSRPEPKEKPQDDLKLPPCKPKPQPKRSLSVPSRHTTKRSVQALQAASQASQKAPLSDEAAGNFELIFPFNKNVENQDLSKGDSAIRAIIAEIRTKEAQWNKACKQLAQQLRQKAEGVQNTTHNSPGK